MGKQGVDDGQPRPSPLSFATVCVVDAPIRGVRRPRKESCIGRCIRVPIPAKTTGCKHRCAERERLLLQRPTGHVAPRARCDRLPRAMTTGVTAVRSPRLRLRACSTRRDQVCRGSSEANVDGRVTEEVAIELHRRLAFDVQCLRRAHQQLATRAHSPQHAAHALPQPPTATGAIWIAP